MAELGATNGGVFEDENESGLMTMIAEWASDDAMMAATDQVGETFNAEAGTEGLEGHPHRGAQGRRSRWSRHDDGVSARDRRRRVGART